MRYLIIAFAVILGAFSTPTFAQVYSNCSVSAGEIQTSGATTECYSNQGEMRVKMYQILLCEGDVSYANYPDRCESIFNSSVGVDVDLGPGKLAANLGSSISIPEGSYQNAIILIDENINLKGTYEFDRAMKGSSNVADKTCWTIAGSKESSYSNMADIPTDCGPAPSPDWLLRRYNIMFDVRTMSPSAALENLTNSTGTYHMYAGQTPTTLTTTNDADYLIGIQEFSPAVQIGPKTTNISVDFLVTNMFHLKTSTSSVPPDCATGGANGCLMWVVPKGFEFKVETR